MDKNKPILLQRLDKRRRGLQTGVFQCYCKDKTIFEAIICEISSGRTKSCGCLRKKIAYEKCYKHGKKYTSEYRAWQSMKERCYCKNHRGYSTYGARGIIVCERWLNSFENFYEDMGDKPSNKHSLERKDVNKNYCPENCVWLLKKYQPRNTTKTLWIEYKGCTKCLATWCEELNLNYNTIRDRIRKHKWDIEKAFETPIKRGMQMKTIIKDEVEIIA